MTPSERALRQLAAAAGFANLASLARHANVDKHSVYAAVSGARKPRSGTVTKLARSLHVSEDIVRRALGSGS